MREKVVLIIQRMEKNLDDAPNRHPSDISHYTPLAVLMLFLLPRLVLNPLQHT